MVGLLALLAWSPLAVARGNGIQAGAGRLHFGADLALVYDSNPSFAGEPTGDLMLRARPVISLLFPSDFVDFALNGRVGYDYYFGVQNSRTSDLSAVTGEADLAVGFNPRGQFSVFIEDVFSRTGDPRYTSLSGRFDRTCNEAKLHLQYKPGGGALMFDLAYGFFLDWYDKTGFEAEALRSYSHRVYLSSKWKFLPKTAVTIDFDSDIRRYPYAYSNGTSNVDLNAIRVTAGLLGQITPSFALLVKAGYGDSLLEAPEGYTGSGYRSAIGQAEATFQRGTFMLQAGYLRTFQPTPLFAFMGQDGFYLRYRQQIAGRFELAANLNFDLLGFGTGVQADAGSRDDMFLVGGLNFAYHILDWLSLSLDYRFQSLFSDYQQPLAGAGGVEYNKHVVTFLVGLDY